MRIFEIEKQEQFAVGDPVVVLGRYSNVSGKRGKIVGKTPGSPGDWIVSMAADNQKYAFSDEELMHADEAAKKMANKNQDQPYGYYEIKVLLSKGPFGDKTQKVVTIETPKPFASAVLYPEAVQKIISDDEQVKKLTKQEGWRVEKILSAKEIPPLREVMK